MHPKPGEDGGRRTEQAGPRGRPTQVAQCSHQVVCTLDARLAANHCYSCLQ